MCRYDESPHRKIFAKRTRYPGSILRTGCAVALTRESTDIRRSRNSGKTSGGPTLHWPENEAAGPGLPQTVYLVPPRAFDTTGRRSHRQNRPSG